MLGSSEHEADETCSRWNLLPLAQLTSSASCPRLGGQSRTKPYVTFVPSLAESRPPPVIRPGTVPPGGGAVMAPLWNSKCLLPFRYAPAIRCVDRKSTRLNSSHSQISYAVFCLKK